MSDPPRPFKVVIVGSGLAGSLLANGLIRDGVDVRVYDRLKQDTKQEGYQIRLGAPALKGMRACLSPDRIQLITQKFGRAGGMKSGAPVVRDDKFKELLDLTKFPSYEKSAPVNRKILREVLAEPVFNAGKLEYGKSFNHYEILDADTPQERVRVWFDDGESDECDVLIGADGSHSKVNIQLGLNNIATMAGYMSFLAKNDLPAERLLSATPTLVEKPVMVFADKKSLYFCAYLPDKLDDGEQSANRDVDDKLSSSFFAINIPTATCPPDIMQRSLDEKWDFVEAALRGWSTEYREMVALVKGADMHVYIARVSSRPAPGWRTKARSAASPEQGHPRVWLMGDAMHAMLPNRGMGGNQSMQDTATALPLLKELARAGQGQARVPTSAIAQAVTAYEDEMIPRAFAWVQKSGGSNMVPLDANTYWGRLLFFLAGQALNVAYLVSLIKALFVSGVIVDDAPELRD